MTLRSLTALLLLALALPAGAAKVRVEGLTSCSEDQALVLLGDRLTYVSARPASPSRADDAAFLLERLLNQQGFSEPVVTWSLPGGDTIVLHVNEGPRSSLGTVTVQGVDETTAANIVAQFETAHRRQKGLLDNTTPYLPENNATGITNATDLLRSEGYWQGSVTIASSRRDPKTGTVNITLEAHTGSLYRLATPRLQTNGGIDPDLARQLNVLTGELANTTNINHARNKVTSFYRTQGFQFADIQMTAEHRGGITRLVFSIKSGERFRVGEVKVTGRKKTKEGRIEERFEGLTGEYYDSGVFDDRIRQLFATGAFQTLRLENTVQPGGVLDVTLHVKEIKPDGYYAYAGVGSFEGGILGAGYYHRNLFGELWNFSTGVEISSIGLLGEVRVTDPWFLGHDLRFTPRLFIQTRTYDGYSKTEAGLGAELEWDLTDHYTLLLSQKNSFVTLGSDGIPSAELGPSPYTVHTLGLTHKYDRRNDRTLPTDGYYLEFTTEAGFASGDASVAFTRIEGRASFYQPVIEDTSYLAAGFRGGMIIPSVKESQLPIDLRYFNGGASTVRSFPERQLGPTASSGDPSGGEAFWAANLEYIHKVAGPVKAVAFLDAGALNPSHADFGAGDIKVAAGLGLRLHLPIGPVRLEYGHALNPSEGDPNGAFHFAIGTAF